MDKGDYFHTFFHDIVGYSRVPDDVKKYINSFANKAKSSIIPRIISYIELECPIEQRKCDICNETGIAHWGDGVYSECVVCREN